MSDDARAPVLTSTQDWVPLFLRFAGRRVLVVGAGTVGTKKALDFVAAGARVVVVAQEPSETILHEAARGTLTLHARAFKPRDLQGAHLVVSATGDATTQSEIFDAAEARGTFVLAVDDPAHGSAASGAVIRRAPFVVAISSSGEMPALTRLIREMLEAALPEDRWVEAARELRATWKRERTPMGARFEQLVRAFAGEKRRF